MLYLITRCNFQSIKSEVEATLWFTVKDTLREYGEWILEATTLFDVYRGGVALVCNVFLQPANEFSLSGGGS